MHNEHFTDVVRAQLQTCEDLLIKKNDGYSPGEDRLEHFKKAAALKGITPQSALSGMMLKHTVSVYDMCESDQDFPLDVWAEKITDHMNYLLLLMAILCEKDVDKSVRFS